MNPLTLTRFNDLIYQVLNDQGAHVGNLKLINGLWKFKAIGYDVQGDVIPGGGPLTHLHNAIFATLDEGVMCAGLTLVNDVREDLCPTQS